MDLQTKSYSSLPDCISFVVKYRVLAFRNTNLPPFTVLSCAKITLDSGSRIMSWNIMSRNSEYFIISNY